MDVTRAILPHMRERKSGVILNVSSGAGVFTLPALSLYCAGKFALEGFSEALSYELLSVGIVVKIIEPGGVLSTSFGARSASEAVKSREITDYEPSETATQKIFAGLRGQRLGRQPTAATSFVILPPRISGRWSRRGARRAKMPISA